MGMVQGGDREERKGQEIELEEGKRIRQLLGVDEEVGMEDRRLIGNIMERMWRERGKMVEEGQRNRGEDGMGKRSWGGGRRIKQANFGNPLFPPERGKMVVGDPQG